MKRILVCEDEDAIREFVVINLKRAGYEVVDVPNGEEALRVYQENKGDFGLALLDIMLPGIDGFTVCKRLREQDKSIGIIMLSAKSQEMDKVNGLMQGADDYVTKPFSPMELVARVDAVFRRVNMSAGKRADLRPLRPQHPQPQPHKGRPENRPDPGGIPADGTLPPQPQHRPGPGLPPLHRVGGQLLWGRQDRRRQRPPPADED